MPARVFWGTGSPMNALENNGYTDAWRAFGRSVPGPGRSSCLRPLVCQRHRGTAMATAPDDPRLSTVSRDAALAVQYPPPGDPSVSRGGRRGRKADLGRLDRDSWGSTTAHGQCSCTPSPMPMSRATASINADSPSSTTMALWLLGTAGCQRGSDPGQRQRGPQPAPHRLGPGPDAGLDWAAGSTMRPGSG